MEKIIFIIWVAIIILSIYFLIQLLRMNAKINIDLHELEECEEMFNLELENFEKIEFLLIPDEHGTILDAEGRRFRLEKKDDQ